MAPSPGSCGRAAPVSPRSLVPQIGRLLVTAILVAGCLPAAELSLPPSPAASATPGTPGSPIPSPTTAQTAAPRPTFVRPTPTPVPTFFAYIVARGDTLTSIAKRFATTPRSIALWNRTTYTSLDPYAATYAPDRIEVGWSLALIPGSVVDEEDLPTATPSPIAASLPPGPTPPPDGTSLLVSHGRRDSNGIALTFDMGGRLDPALDIVEWLISHGVRATVFPTGETGSTTAIGTAVLDRLAAHPDLFSIGNHSWDHPDFRTLDPATMVSQLERTEAAIVAATGRSTKPFFRPPYGSQDAAVRAAVGGAGWSLTVMWDVDTIDWMEPSEGGPTATDIEAKVLSRARGGSIVLMHLGGWHTLEALPGIVDGLRERGLEPVTLEDLLLGG